MSDGRIFFGVLAFLAGGLAGAGLALLYSPVSGREARERVGELARDYKKKTKEWAGGLKQNVGRISDEERSQIDAMAKEMAFETPTSE
jgi:gas vesicle protein